MLKRSVHFDVVAAALLALVAACTQLNPTDVTSCDQFGVGCTQDELQTQLELVRGRLAAAQAGTGGEQYPDIVNPVLLRCQQQNYTGSVTVIGPSGGQVSFGPHKITFPPGALNNNVVVSGELLVANHVLVELYPSGLQLSAPAVLELAYGTCQSGGNGLEVAYVDDNLNVISYPAAPLGGTISGEVRAELWHFSKYAVAY